MAEHSADMTLWSGEPTAAVPCLALRAREAAKAIGVSERTLWSWVETGAVPHVRRGRVVLFPVDALRDWLAKQIEAQCQQQEGYP